MKTIIAGSRSINQYTVVCRAIQNSGFEITEVVSGHANGVDKLGELWANSFTPPIPVTRFIPHWTALGKKAGFLRNAKMAEYADALIAIWDGESRGTGHMISFARGRGLKVYVLEHPFGSLQMALAVR